MFFAGTAAQGGTCPLDAMPHTATAIDRFVLDHDLLGDLVPQPGWENWAQTIDVPLVARHCRPTRLDQLVSIVRAAKAAGGTVRAVGSGWSFSDVAKPSANTFFVETDALDALLWNVLNLVPSERRRKLVHVEAGIKIHVLNDLLDALGLAMPTLGGSGGQSIAGVISTGTHGGDIALPPIADAVRAIHLVGPDGTQYWVERKTAPITTLAEASAALPWIDPANIRYDDNWFNALIVSMGSMGILYSLILEARAPYDLEETVVKTDWASARALMANGSIWMRLQPDGTPFLDDNGAPERHRFVQVLVTPNSPANGDRVCFVSTRQEAQPSPNIPDVPGFNFDVLTMLCQFGNLGPLILTVVIPAVSVAMAAAVAAALLVPFFGGLLAAIVATAFSTAIAALGTLAATNPNLETGIVEILNILDAIGLNVLVRELNGLVLSMGLSTGTKQNKSYKIMDTFNYAAPNCILVDSVEVFFDATQPNFLATIDQLLSTIDGAGNVVGYFSMRFTGPTRATLGMQQAPLNCSAEISILKGVPDNDAVIRAIEDFTIAHGGRLHWGQRNERLNSTNLNAAMYPGLAQWKTVRNQLTSNGTLTTFDNSFTVQMGL
jgi:hypothetical protein